MNRFQFCSLVFIWFLLAPIQIHAFIGSAYRIHIKGLGTIILLGDQQDPAPDADQEQCNLLSDFLRSLSEQNITTVFNVETLHPAPEYYTDADSRNSMIRNRLSEREIAPNLRSFVAELEKSDLNKKIHFTSSDPRHSSLWNISRNTQLKSLVEQALKKEETHTANTSLKTAELDYEQILKKHFRFLDRSKNKMPSGLYSALEKSFDERLNQVKQAHKSCKAFFHKYSNQLEPLKEQELQTIIYNYAIQKVGSHALFFNERTQEIQKQAIQIVTTSLLQKLQKKFNTEHTSNMIHIPWAMDLFNAFTHHEAKTVVFYANDSHIHYLTLFLRSLQKRFNDETVKFEVEFTLAKRPLSREQFKKILDIKTS